MKKKKEITKEDLVRELIKATSIFHKKLDKIETQASQLWWEKAKEEIRKSIFGLEKWNEKTRSKKK